MLVTIRRTKATNSQNHIYLTTTEKTLRVLKYYFYLWGLYILFFIGLAITKKYFPELLNQEYEQNFLQEMLKNNPLKLFVLAVIFAPIMEEMMFRTLIKPSHNDIILLLCSWPIFYLNRFIPVDVHWVLKICFIAIVIFTLFYITKQLIPLSKTARFRSFLHGHHWYILVLSSVIFGLVHINNYVDNFIINAALVALIIPRIISGFMMGLIKIKNENLVWSMGLHAMNNGFVIIILLIARSSAT